LIGAGIGFTTSANAIAAVGNNEIILRVDLSANEAYRIIDKEVIIRIHYAPTPGVRDEILDGTSVFL